MWDYRDRWSFLPLSKSRSRSSCLIRLPLPLGTWEEGNRPSLIYLNRVALLTLR
jgi:hypothetical protein